MTTDNRKKLVGLLLPLLAVLVGTLLTAAAFILAMFASSACHCSRPITFAFPLATMLWATGRMEWLGGAVMALQFPAYALLVALGRTRPARARHALILLIVHIVTVGVGWFVSAR